MTTPRPCKGLVYRFRSSVFLEKTGAIATVSRWVPQKRLSCPGCCDCIGYSIEAHAKDAGAEAVEIHADNPVDGGYYVARWVPDPVSGPDWGYEGDGHWEMVQVGTPIKRSNSLFTRVNA